MDELFCRVCLPLVDEQDSLLSFLFHGVFESREELECGTIDPQQGITLQMFKAFVTHFRKQSYVFVSPNDILSGLGTGYKYVLVSFDDGYWNNLRAIPILEEFQIPAVFFISTEHVCQGKAFWWDVVYRELRKRGRSDEIPSRLTLYKKCKTSEIEADLRREFGARTLDPVSDLDRPLTVPELKALAGHKLVQIGNHTKDHAILTNYSLPEVDIQIRIAQESLAEITGRVPSVIAYPNGSESSGIYSRARAAGLRLGIGVKSGRNRLPIVPESMEAMSLRRFTLWGDRSIDAQCRVSRSNVSMRQFLTRARARTSASLLSGKEQNASFAGPQ